jgi:NAD(P)-dependent dehydrogenase (short-subunit alcohol dehydrogenase family)
MPRPSVVGHFQDVVSYLKKILFLTHLLYRIGFGAAQILLDAGAHVTVISSSLERVEEAVKRLASPNADGKVGDVREEDNFTKLLVSLAPLDHVVFSGVDKIIRGKLADADLDDAKHLFGVKFWGSIVVGKGSYTSGRVALCKTCFLTRIQHWRNSTLSTMAVP